MNICAFVGVLIECVTLYIQLTQYIDNTRSQMNIWSVLLFIESQSITNVQNVHLNK